MKRKDKASINGIMFSIFTVLFTCAIIMLGINYSNATWSKMNIENAQIEASFAGFRTSEDYYIHDGTLVLNNEIFDMSCKGFLNHLKRNLKLDDQDSASFSLIPKADSYIPHKSIKGDDLQGEVQEVRMYCINDSASDDSHKILCMKKTSGGSPLSFYVDPTQNIEYGGEIIMKASELKGNGEDCSIILCTKVRYPQSNWISLEGDGNTTYQTKTCAVRWSSEHVKKNS